MPGKVFVPFSLEIVEHRSVEFEFILPVSFNRRGEMKPFVVIDERLQFVVINLEERWVRWFRRRGEGMILRENRERSVFLRFDFPSVADDRWWLIMFATVSRRNSF